MWEVDIESDIILRYSPFLRKSAPITNLVYLLKGGKISLLLVETEKQLSPELKHMKLKYTNIYFQNYLDDKNQKKTTLVIETPNGIDRSQIKKIEALTKTRFSKFDIRPSPMLGYETIAEAVFVRA